MTMQQQLVFSLPSEEEAIYLCENKEAFHKYKLSLAYLTDYLSHFVDYHTRPGFTLDEALQHISAIADEAVLAPLKNHIRTNQSIAMKLNTIWKKDPEVAQRLIFQYLDMMNRWSTHLLKAFREKDFAVAKEFLTPKKQYRIREQAFRAVRGDDNFADRESAESDISSFGEHEKNGRRKNQHVVRRESGWAVRGEGNSRDTIRTRTQKEAIKRARDIARQQNSEVIIHGRDGKIRGRNSYGNDSA